MKAGIAERRIFRLRRMIRSRNLSTTIDGFAVFPETPETSCSLDFVRFSKYHTDRSIKIDHTPIILWLYYGP